MSADANRQNALYEEAARSYGPAIDRLARSYEHDPDKRRDLQQDIHLALWRSLGRFNGDCSLRTWVFRVAHNVAATFVLRHRRARSSSWVSLDALEEVPDDRAEESLDRVLALDRLYALIDDLEPSDRQLVLLYLEGLDAASIGEVTGLSASNVATKIHRIKKIIARRVSPSDSAVEGAR